MDQRLRPRAAGDAGRAEYIRWQHRKLTVGTQAHAEILKKARQYIDRSVDSLKRFEQLVTAISEATLPPDAAGDLELKAAVSHVFSSLNGLALDLLQVEPELVEAKVELLSVWIANAQT